MDNPNGFYVKHKTFSWFLITVFTIACAIILATWMKGGCTTKPGTAGPIVPPEIPLQAQAKPIQTVLSKPSSSKPTGNIFPIPHGHPFGITGLADEIYTNPDGNDPDEFEYTCNLGVTGYIVGNKNTFSTEINVRNVTTGWTWNYYKVGLEPSIDCFSSKGCVWTDSSGNPICPPDSILAAGHLFCMPDSSYDIYRNRGKLGIALLDTNKDYQYAVLVRVNEPLTIPEKNLKDNQAVFGFVARYDNIFRIWQIYYDTSFITPQLVNLLKHQ